MILEELKTRRLILRKYTPETYKHLYQSCTDEEIMETLALKFSDELKEQKERYSKGLSTYNRSFVYFKLFDIKSGEHVGNCGFHTWYTQHSRAEIGYDIIDDSKKKKGLMSEALEAIIDYGFNNMNLNRIEALVGLDNIASLKLLNKFGFVKEGLLRQHYNKGAQIEDSLIFSLLKEEWGQTGS